MVSIKQNYVDDVVRLRHHEVHSRLNGCHGQLFDCYVDVDYQISHQLQHAVRQREAQNYGQHQYDLGEHQSYLQVCVRKVSVQRLYH
jgi:hypothetical protein